MLLEESKSSGTHAKVSAESFHVYSYRGHISQSMPGSMIVRGAKQMERVRAIR
jgi:hypothetical protein